MHVFDGWPRNRTHPFHIRRINFDCDRALQQSDGEDEAVRAPHSQQNTPQPLQRARLNLDWVTYPHEGPWLIGQTGGRNCVYCIDFGFINGYRRAVIPYNPDHTWGRQYWKSVLYVHAAKQVARKEGGFDDFDTI